MGHIDNIGRLLSLYRIKMDSRKRFYLKIFYHFADLAVINSWLQFRRDHKDSFGIDSKTDLWQFKSQIADSLSRAHQSRILSTPGRKRFSDVEYGYFLKRKRGPVKPLPLKEVRTDNTGHWPNYSQIRGRCKLPGCKGNILTKCTKCDVHLCLTPQKNCFMKFHVE